MWKIMAVAGSLLFLIGCSTGNELNLVNDAAGAVTFNFRANLDTMWSATRKTIKDIPNGEFIGSGTSGFLARMWEGLCLPSRPSYLSRTTPGGPCILLPLLLRMALTMYFSVLQHPTAQTLHRLNFFSHCSPQYPKAYLSLTIVAPWPPSFGIAVVKLLIRRPFFPSRYCRTAVFSTAPSAGAE